MSNGQVSVIITAGGMGRRFGGDKPKQFADLGGKPVLTRTAALFEGIDCVSDIIMTVPDGYVETAWRDIVNAYHLKKVKEIISGGPDRQSSVYIALRRLSPSTGIVLIHDGVRPFVSEKTVNDVIASVREGYAAIAGVTMTDTVKVTDRDGLVTATLNREALWSVQTPQGFGYGTILCAHEQAAKDGYIGTDDGSLVERLQLAPVKMIPGDRHNIKITTPEDWVIGRSLLEMGK